MFIYLKIPLLLHFARTYASAQLQVLVFKSVLQVTQLMLSPWWQYLKFIFNFYSDQRCNRPNMVQCLPCSYHRHSASHNPALKFYFLFFILLLQASQVLYSWLVLFCWNIVSIAHIYKSSDTSSKRRTRLNIKSKPKKIKNKIWKWKEIV